MRNLLVQLRDSKTSNWKTRGYKIENLTIPGWEDDGLYEVVNILHTLGY